MINSQSCLLLFALMVCQIIPTSAQSLTLSVVDNSSYTGKAMFGYQGWFAHPDDMSPRPVYWHWGNMDQMGVIPLEVDMYPDLREYCSSEQYPTAYTLPNGDTAHVFSSGNKQTVMRHMKWVRDYDVDGIFLQRFISEYGDPVVMEFRDSTTAYVMEGCEMYGRVFSIMYDGVAMAVDEIKADWMHLVDDLEILESDRYLQHDNRPLVALWGYTFYNQATVEQLDSLIQWFHTDAPPQYRASIKLGLNDSWFSLDQNWLDAFSQVEVISPWSVGRFADSFGYNSYLQNQLLTGKAWCDSRDILFVPVIFPGFSWYNLMDGNAPQNEIPRDGGNFFWMQAHGAVNNGFESMYFAMLDELDESTAFFKTAETSQQAPAQDYWLTLDEDGYDLPSDWYLRCAGKAAQTLRGKIPNTPSLGIPAEGLMTIQPDHNNCVLQFIFPNFDSGDVLEISLDGGMSFPYSTADSLGLFEITGLAIQSYDIVVRHPDGDALPMGKTCISCSVNSIEGGLFKTIQVFPNPASELVHISGIEGPVQIFLHDMQGCLLLQMNTREEQVMLNMESVKKGIYVLSLVGANGRFSQTIVVE